ncbi:hypothetical protein [Litoribacter populi]|uniref:hypothetical protein n=1 Tax=Litoribacter populi TaxID=2598460 RepID=UPI00117C1E65|nr:hypothetical protein [Litoribacter populi]
MKTQDSGEERDLKLFFSELKKRDEKLSIPDFPKPQKKKHIGWLPIGIAATFIALLWFFYPTPPSSQIEGDIIIITLVEGENQEQELLIEKTTYMDVWEPQTSSLLTEF